MNYQRIYNQLIEKARNENRLYGEDSYYERHHIIPKCIGGEGRVSQWKTHPNIAVITAREHLIAHQLLCRIYPTEGKLAFALWRMCTGGSTNQDRDYRISSRSYESARQEQAYHIAKVLKGVPKPEGFGDSISAKLKGRVGSWAGKKQSPQHIEKRAASRRGKVGAVRTREVEEKIQATRQKNKSGTKKILQYNKSGDLIKEWESLTNAATCLRIPIACISSSIAGVQKTAGGFIWKLKQN